MFERYMIDEKSISSEIGDNEVKSFEFNSKLPYYRGIPLSMVEIIKINIDGNEFPLENITLNVRNKDYSLSNREMETIERWEFGEISKIKVDCPDGIKKGKHQLNLQMVLRIGYLPFPALRNFSTEIEI